MPKTKQFDIDEALQKAKELFREKGYNGTSMGELVKATGLNRSSLYDTFGDKHSLYIQSLQHYQKEMQDSLAEQLKKMDSPRKKIRQLFHHTVQQILKDPRRKGCFMVNATTELANLDKEIEQLASTNLENMEQQFYQWVKEGQDMGEINKTHSPKALARFLFNSFSGLRVTGQTKPDKATLEDIVKVTLAALD